MSTDKFRKKPVVIEAFQLPAAGDSDAERFLAWADKVGFENWNSARDEGLDIETLEGVMRADPGDWVIKGVKGEFYPCKPDIFAATYEKADSPARYGFDDPAMNIAQKIMECRATAFVDDWPDVRLKAAIQCLVIEAMKWAAPAAGDDLTAADYEEVLTDHRRLVRELDVLINGDNAAQQASLCDIVGQVRSEGLKAAPAAPAAWSDVVAERQRQVSAEGWTAEHDDAHISGELAGAAACYARHVNGRQWVYPGDPERYELEEAPLDWPWDDAWWKPKSPRSDLVRAGALILAEIERLDRAENALGGDDA